MVGKRIVHAACGDDFTVVATAGIKHAAHIIYLISCLSSAVTSGNCTLHTVDRLKRALP